MVECLVGPCFSLRGGRCPLLLRLCPACRILADLGSAPDFMTLIPSLVAQPLDLAAPIKTTLPAASCVLCAGSWLTWPVLLV